MLYSMGTGRKQIASSLFIYYMYFYAMLLMGLIKPFS